MNKRITKQRQVFIFRYQPYADSSDDVLLRFLEAGDGIRCSREMAIQALRMCYLALAYQWADTLSDEELRQVSLNCCNALEQQLMHLRQTLHLPASSVSTAGTAVAIAPTSTPVSAPIEMSQPVVAPTANLANSKRNPVVESDDLLPGKGSFQDETGLFDGI
ncbi:hypothetical protein C7B80_03125 [Cyanosarcina cf. burmensis CCALA 770]|nr:hypothetical protein C7B80_03125 [Cyanosarcina cf. burmensis CCALA 770]